MATNQPSQAMFGSPAHRGSPVLEQARLVAGAKALAAACLAVLTCGTPANPARADEPTVNTGLMQFAQGAVTPTGLPNAVIAPPALPPGQNPYALADTLKIRGWVIGLPGAADTIDQGLFGVRNALAENGISYFGISATTFQDNTLRHQLPAGNYFGPHSRDNQLYGGQLPTYMTQNQLFALYDLQRYGIADGQLEFDVSSISTNWNPAGPNGLYLAAASYYQTFLNKKLEIKIGLLQNSVEFLGAQVGGSLASGVFGPNASIPVENGLNSSGFSTLGVNVRYNFPDNFYTKGTVQRAISPDGSIAERLGNPTGLNLKVRNAGVLVLDEVGYRVNPSPGEMQTWIRGALSVTTSRYRELANTAHREQSDYGIYFLADRQLLHTASNAGFGSSRRGIYAGFTVEHAPSYFNAFDQYYEGRLYGFGLIPGRPNDLISLVANHSQFSGEAVQAARNRGLLAHGGVTSYTASYGAQALPGVNINAGLSFTDHPTAITYTRSTGSALNILLNAILFL
jgi:porin